MTDTTIAPWACSCVPRRTVSEVMARRNSYRALPKGIWLELARELALRLEQTPSRDALKVEFASVALARRAFAGLRHYLRANQVEIHKHDHILYIARGPEFKKGDYKHLS